MLVPALRELMPSLVGMYRCSSGRGSEREGGQQAMTEEEIAAALIDNVVVGFAIKHDDGSFSMTSAGKAFVEQIIIPDVTKRAEIFSLGYLQGLREGKDSKP